MMIKHKELMIVGGLVISLSLFQRGPVGGVKKVWTLRLYHRGTPLFLKEISNKGFALPGKKHTFKSKYKSEA